MTTVSPQLQEALDGLLTDVELDQFLQDKPANWTDEEYYATLKIIVQQYADVITMVKKSLISVVPPQKSTSRDQPP